MLMTGGGAREAAALSDARATDSAGRADRRGAGSPTTCARGGVITPMLTDAARVLRRRARGARHGPRPARDLQGDLQRHRPELVFPWISAEDRTIAALNLQQTLIADDAADPHRPRGRVRVPCRPVQHRRPGPVHRRRDRGRLGRLVVRRACRTLPAHRPARSWPRCAGGALWGGIAGRAEGDDGRQRGDHDDHAQLDRALGRRLAVRPRRAAAERHAAVESRSPTTSCDGAKLPVFWGDPELQGLHIGLFIALAALRRVLGAC